MIIYLIKILIIKLQMIKSIKVGPYYSIHQITTKDINGLSKLQYRYQFFSILKFNTSPLAIYNHYFQSIYKKSHLPDSQKQFSIFFEIFIKIFILKRLVDCYFLKQTHRVKLIFDELSYGLYDKKITKRLRKNIEQLLKIQLTKFQKNYPKFDKQKSDIYRSVIVQKQIDSLLKDLQQKLHKQNQLQKLKLIQYLPEKWLTPNINNKFILKQIMYNFKRIRNCKFLSIDQRQKGINELINTNVNYLNLKIQYEYPQYIYQSQNRNQKQILAYDKKMQKQKPILGKLSLLTFSKFQPQQTKIATKIQNCLLDLKKNNDPRRDVHLMKNIIKDIIQQSSNYNSKTKCFYPSISLSDIYFDQKKLRCFISEQKLILNGVGYCDNILNAQMKILFGTTPNGIEFQKCHLQCYDIIGILLNRKKQSPVNSKKYHENHLNRQQQSKIDFEQSKIEEQLQFQQEKIIVKEYQNNTTGLNQNIHVWRLINIFYYILKQQNLNKHLYNNYNENGKLQSICEEKRFFFKKYRSIMKKLYQMMKSGDISVPHLLLQGQQNSNSHSKQSALWSFTIKSLKNMYNFQETDSLIEDMAFTRIKSQFYLRVIILKQIQSLLYHDCFKHLINSKKYFVSHFVNGMEYFYKINRVIQQSQEKPQKRTQIISSLNFQYRNIKLNSKHFLEKLSSTSDKLKRYNLKNPGDLNKRFIEQNNKLYAFALEINQSIQQINQMEENLRIMNQSISDKNSEKQIIEEQLNQNKRKYKVQMQDLRKFCATKFKKASDSLTLIIKKSLQSIKIRQLRKKDKNYSLKYYEFILKKLIVTLKVYQTLNKQNTRNSQFYLIFDQQIQGNSNKKQKKLIGRLKQSQFQNLMP